MAFQKDNFKNVLLSTIVFGSLASCSIVHSSSNRVIDDIEQPINSRPTMMGPDLQNELTGIHLNNNTEVKEQSLPDNIYDSHSSLGSFERDPQDIPEDNKITLSVTKRIVDFRSNGEFIPSDFCDTEEGKVVGMTILNEAGSVNDQKYVAQVIANRIQFPEFPDTAREVVEEVGQFHHPGISSRVHFAEDILAACDVFTKVEEGILKVPDEFSKATFFHSKPRLQDYPDWAFQLPYLGKEGRNKYYGGDK